MTMPTSVKLVEVGPRDGLQNEPSFIETDQKIEFINQLSQTGLSAIEVTSFVSPNWIPQLADADAVLTGIQRNSDVTYSALVPNVTGFEDARKQKLQAIAVFTTVSETFSQKNTNGSIEQSLSQIEKIVALAKKNHYPVRGYISCSWGCPYEGSIDFQKSADMAKQLHDWGCDEISLSDTIGIATPGRAQQLIEHSAQVVPLSKLAVHFHNTYGQALANIFAVLQQGVHIVDSSIAGLGGCPYAKGATGNVATEDVLYMLNGLGIETGVSLEKLCQVSSYITNLLGKPSSAFVNTALVTAPHLSQHSK